MTRAHLHQELEVNFIASGGMTYLIGGRTITMQAGDFSVFWAALPHQVVRVEPATHFHWFTVPFAWLLQWGMQDSFIANLLRGEHVTDRLSGPSDLTACQRWMADLDDGGHERIRIAQLEIEARIRRLVLAWSSNKRTDDPMVVSQPAIGVIETIASFIATRYTEPLTIANIVQPTGLHPNYAMALFRKTCGMSILDYLNQHRIFHARRLLITTNRTILDIAMDCGFGSQSRFYQAFKKACHCSPGKFRTQPMP